jgi:hypothetical protein
MQIRANTDYFIASSNSVALDSRRTAKGIPGFNGAKDFEFLITMNQAGPVQTDFRFGKNILELIK